MLPFRDAGPCPSDEVLAAYLGGTLPEADRERAELHLAACEECLDTIVAAHEARTGELAERAVRKIEGLVAPRRLPVRRFPRRRERGPAGLVAAVAAAVFVGVVALVAVTSRQPANPPPVAEKGPRVDPPAPEPPPPPPEPLREKPAEPRPDPPPRPKPLEESRPAVRPPEPKEPRPVPPPPPEPPRPEPPRTVVEAALTVEAASGDVRLGERAVRKGDRLTPAQTLRTAFASHGRVEAGGAVFAFHQTTQVALGPGPSAKVIEGRLFVKSAPGLRVETPAGSVTPIGTEFAVDVAGDETWVAVREGAVVLENAHGKATVRKDQVVRCLRGRAPGAAARLAGPAAHFDWAEKTAAPAYVMLYPGPRKNAGVVIAAPHSPYVGRTAEVAAAVAERLRVACVIGHGYARRGDYDWVHLPGGTPEEKAVFAEYARLVREGAGVSPARLVVQVLGMGGPATNERDEPVIEVATAGFTKEDAQRMKESFAAIVRKHKPETEMKLVLDLTDPKYEVGGREVSFRTGASRLRQAGIFRSDIAARGLHVTLPWTVRATAGMRGQYGAILADWLESIR